MSPALASLAKDLERLAKKARTAQQARSQRVEALIRELESARAALDSQPRLPVDEGTPAVVPSQAGGALEDGAGGAEVGDKAAQQDTAMSSTGGVTASDEGSEAVGLSRAGVDGVLERLQSDVAAAAGTGAAAKEDKELTSMLSKLGKAVDKIMPPDLAKAVRYVPLPPSFFANAVLEHFVRSGRIDLARTLAREASLPLDEALVAPYVALVAIAKDLERKHLDPALEFVSAHREALERQGAALPFLLHQRRFLQLLQAQRVQDAIQHARAHFPQFYAARGAEVRSLMGCVAFLKRGLGASPYRHLVADSHWPALAHCFWREACDALGVPHDRPLAVAVDAGVQGLPTLHKFCNVMQARLSAWADAPALPLEIDLGSGYHFHSVFMCPVSREQSSRDNPPMRLQCGHVVCEQSLRKLPRSAGRIKCPYCPAEVSVADSLRLFF